MKKVMKLFLSLFLTCSLISVTSISAFASTQKVDSSTSQTPATINSNANVKFITYTYATAPKDARKQYEEDCKSIDKIPNPSDTIMVKADTKTTNSIQPCYYTASDFICSWVTTTNNNDFINAFVPSTNIDYNAYVNTDLVGYNHITNGQAVDIAQLLLDRCGYNLVIDGIFGPGTHSALESFQRNHNLSVDCIIGTNTWTTLYNTSFTR